MVGEDEECPLWSRPIDTSVTPEAEPASAATSSSSASQSKALSVGGRTARAASKRQVSSTSPPALRLSSADLNLLFETAGSGPETFENLRRMAAKGMRFSSVSELIQAATQLHLLHTKRRQDLLSLLQHPSCTIFSRCTTNNNLVHQEGGGYVFLLTLSDCKRLWEVLEEEQQREEEEWIEEEKRVKAGMGGEGGFTSSSSQLQSTSTSARPTYASTLLPSESTSIHTLISYPLSPRVFRILRELSETQKKVSSFQDLLHVVRVASWEVDVREEGVWKFLNDRERCRCIGGLEEEGDNDVGGASSTDSDSRRRGKSWTRAHVRRLLQEVATANSREDRRDDGVSSDLSPSSTSSTYIGLSDCLLLLWNLNASGRRFTSFTEIVQALRTEYVLAGEFVKAQQLMNNSGGTNEDGVRGERALGHDDLGAPTFAGASQALISVKASGGTASTTTSELLVTTPTYLDTLHLHTVTYSGQPRHAFSWESVELEYLFHVSMLSPGLLTSALKVKYLSWQTGKQSLLHFFARKNNPIFVSHAPGSPADDVVLQTMHFLQTEQGINMLWYASGAREYCLQYLGLLVSTHRSFDSLADLIRTLKSMHRKRILETKVQALIESYESTMSRNSGNGVFITDEQRKIVLDFLASEESTIFRPAAAGASTSAGKNHSGAGAGAGEKMLSGSIRDLPGQEPLQIERDPYALPVLPSSSPVTKHVGVTLTTSQVDSFIREGAGGSLQLLLLYLRYLSRFSRSFTSPQGLLPVLKQLHQEHVERCKQTLKFFYRADCLLLNCSGGAGGGEQKMRGQDGMEGGGSTSSQLLLLVSPTKSTSSSTSANIGSSSASALSRAELDDAEVSALDLNGLNGGGSSTGVDLSMNDMSVLLREATGGLPALPHLQTFDAQRLRFRSFAHLVGAVREAQRQSESEQTLEAHRQKYTDACREFLASPWTGLFTDTIHSQPILPTQQEFATLLQACGGSPTALLVSLHTLNSSGRKFRAYSDLTSALLVATQEASERAAEIWTWVRSKENKLFAHAASLPDEKHVAGDQQQQRLAPAVLADNAAVAAGAGSDDAADTASAGRPFEWTWSHVTRLFEETDAAGDTLSHLYTLNTLGARFYRFSALLAAVTEQHEKLKTTRAEQVQATRRKEGKALVRSYLLDPSTHLFAVPVQLHDGHIAQLYEVGEQGETAVGIRLLGKRTRAGAATVHCLQALEAMRPSTAEKFPDFASLLVALQGASVNLIIERSETLGIGEVSHKPPEVLSAGGLQSLAGVGGDASESASSTAPQLSLASVPGVAPFLLSVADKQLILEYLSSPQCSLFASLASSPVRQTLAVRNSDLQAMAAAAGDGSNAVALLKRLDQTGAQFETFEALVYAIKVEALARPPPATLSPDQCVTLLAYLSRSFLLYDRSDLSHKLSKGDLVKLVEVSGKTLANTMCNLNDLSENHGQLVPATTWQQLVDRAEANWNALARLKREVLAFLIAEERQLFAAKAPDHEMSLTLAAMDTLFVQAASGAHTLTYLLSFTRAGQSFSSLQELTISVRSAHLATMNIQAAQTEREVQSVLQYLGTSKHIVQLFSVASSSSPAAAGGPVVAPSIAVSDAGIREMLKLAGTATAVVQTLNLLYDRGTRVRTFDELLQTFRLQVLQQYK